MDEVGWASAVNAWAMVRPGAGQDAKRYTFSRTMGSLIIQGEGSIEGVSSEASITSGNRFSVKACREQGGRKAGRSRSSPTIGTALDEGWLAGWLGRKWT